VVLCFLLCNAAKRSPNIRTDVKIKETAPLSSTSSVSMLSPTDDYSCLLPVMESVGSFLTAHQHKTRHSAPYSDRETSSVWRPARIRFGCKRVDARQALCRQALWSVPRHLETRSTQPPRTDRTYVATASHVADRQPHSNFTDIDDDDDFAAYSVAAIGLQYMRNDLPVVLYSR